MKLETKLLVAFITVIMGFSCSKNEEENRTNEEGSSQAAANDSAENVVIEDSSELLKVHTEDLNALGTTAGELALTDIQSNAKNLATIYDFTIQSKLNKALYGEAVYEWNKADLDYKRLEIAYSESANPDLAELWTNYQTSRATMLKLKKLWQDYRD